MIFRKTVPYISLKFCFMCALFVFPHCGDSNEYHNEPKFWTNISGQTVQTLIRLLLEEQSDQGLHCLLFHLHVFDKIPSGLASLFEF